MCERSAGGGWAQLSQQCLLGGQVVKVQTWAGAGLALPLVLPERPSEVQGHSLGA